MVSPFILQTFLLYMYIDIAYSSVCVRCGTLFLVELGRFVALLSALLSVILDVLVQLVFLPCFVLMKFVSMFLLNLIFVVCCLAVFDFMVCVV